MKKIILIGFLFILCSSIQTPSLIGKWKYVKFETTEKLDNELKKTINQLMSVYNLDFKVDGTYIVQRTKKKQETGAWKADKKYVTTHASNGTEEKIKFIQIHNDTLKLNIEKERYLVFSRE